MFQTRSLNFFPFGESHEGSSLHNIIFNAFRLVSILWSLLLTNGAFSLKRHSRSKKVLVEMESSHCMGGATTFLALFQQIYLSLSKIIVTFHLY